MAIPDYQTVMLPLLRVVSDQDEHSIRAAIEKLAAEFKLSDEERRELLPSGKQPVFDNRVAWARTYLKNARLLEYTRRGHFKISERGLEELKENPTRIDKDYLTRFPAFQEFRSRSKKKEVHDAEKTTRPGLAETPEEALESSFQDLRDNLAQELLDQILASPPSLFEKLVVELLVNMGYGGTHKDASKAIERSGDEGIDGIINEDRLGLDTIYLQAKRWQNVVGRPEIQKFAGALQGQRAKKGVFITTSTFSKDARDYASRIETRIVLIGGDDLTQLMIDYNIGVTPVQRFELKRLDSGYFTYD